MSECSYSIIGSCNDPDMFYCQGLLNKLVYKTKESISVTLEALLEVDYRKRLQELKRKQTASKKMLTHTATHLVLRNDEYFGHIYNVKQMVQNYLTEEEIEPDYSNNRILAKNEIIKCLGSSSAVHLNFSTRGSPEEKGEDVFGEENLLIQLFTDVCPIACSNFIKLCTGEAGKLTGTNTKLHYLNCPIHRLVPGGWLQCGDIVDGTGQNSIAAIGENNKIQDENLSIDFSEEMGGMVGYSTSMPHSNGSQFFITLGPCAWMNHKYVGIGRVVQGFKTLKQISAASTKNQKPVETIFISSCGLENQKPVEIP